MKLGLCSLKPVMLVPACRELVYIFNRRTGLEFRTAPYAKRSYELNGNQDRKTKARVYFDELKEIGQVVTQILVQKYVDLALPDVERGPLSYRNVQVQYF